MQVKTRADWEHLASRRADEMKQQLTEALAAQALRVRVRKLTLTFACGWLVVGWQAPEEPASKGGPNPGRASPVNTQLNNSVRPMPSIQVAQIEAAIGNRFQLLTAKLEECTKVGSGGAR